MCYWLILATADFESGESIQNAQITLKFQIFSRCEHLAAAHSPGYRRISPALFSKYRWTIHRFDSSTFMFGAFLLSGMTGIGTDHAFVAVQPIRQVAGIP
ncbi:hypothetical protein D3C76_667160 [compost metagenome]|uniref:hypothetical protein n=1 Tax=Pseudomonas fluorescens TaxID=294 RepID=UPI000F9B5446|nr:hypothetical protein [Pseudomonas fluorescens]VVM48142.1 hypothetical protein PS647_00652 [Pseudomonas fluorescens]